MQNATRRTLRPHLLRRHESRPFDRIDGIDARLSSSLFAKPIARLTAALVSTLQRMGPIDPCALQSACDKDALSILNNARRMGRITRSQWQVGSNSAGT